MSKAIRMTGKPPRRARRNTKRVCRRVFYSRSEWALLYFLVSFVSFVDIDFAFARDAAIAGVALIDAVERNGHAELVQVLGVDAQEGWHAGGGGGEGRQE